MGISLRCGILNPQKLQLSMLMLRLWVWTVDQLMIRAAQGLHRCIQGTKVMWILCGPGNNGVMDFVWR